MSCLSLLMALIFRFIGLLAERMQRAKWLGRGLGTAGDGVERRCELECAKKSVTSFGGHKEGNKRASPLLEVDDDVTGDWPRLQLVPRTRHSLLVATQLKR